MTGVDEWVVEYVILDSLNNYKLGPLELSYLIELSTITFEAIYTWLN
jgi:hypothetical protein